MSAILRPVPTMYSPGIYRGLSFREYCQIPACNRSFIWKMMTQSPAHAQAGWNEDDETEALGFGRGFHELILTPHTFEKNFFVRQDINRSTTAGRIVKAREEGLEALGQEGVTSKDYWSMQSMKLAIQNNKSAAALLDAAPEDFEVTIVWEDADTGVLCKARLDCLNERLRCLPDLKTTKNAHPSKFRWSIRDYGYHFQGAMYGDGAKAIGLDVDSFLVIACEKKTPYGVAVYDLDLSSIQEGRRQYKRQLEVFRDLQQMYGDGPWPAYPDEVTTISISMR